MYPPYAGTGEMLLYMKGKLTIETFKTLFHKTEISKYVFSMFEI
jgi:hypothetical protein